MQQFPFIDLFNQLYMFRAMFSPILRSSLTIFTALAQCTDLLPTGDTIEMELSSKSIVSPFGSKSVHCTRAVYTVKLPLKMGENIARNMYI
jgi:hypothetical protein